MALKVVSISSELNVLRALVHKDRKIAGTVLSNCDESYFYTDESLEIFGAIKKYMAEYGTLPSYKLLMADTDISKKARKFFKKSEQVADSIDAAKKLLRNLQKYRQRRAIADLAENLVTAMSQEEKMNIDRTLDMASTAISNARAKKSNSDAFTHFGKNNNSRKIIQDILWGNREDSLIPTGIDIYDQEAGGWPRGGLVTIGANSGGGKSVLASAVAVKMVSAGYKVLLVPLEMSVEEMTCRIIANVTKTNLTKLMTQDLTENEKREIDRKFTKWLKKVKKKGGQYTLFKPEEDLTLEEVYAATGAYDYDVSIVDYVTLLAEMDGDDQWRKIGAAGRFAKIDAENRKRVNVLLAQVNDEGKIRYSRALTEHCVTGDTLIDTDKGRVRIDSLYPEAKVMSTKPLEDVLVKSEGEYRPASGVHYNGIREVYEVTLSDGKSIKCTAQHKFLMLNQDGSLTWERLRNLRAGDTLAIDHGKSKFGKTLTLDVPQVDAHEHTVGKLPKKVKVDANLGYVLGCIVSDGYVGKHGFDFIASDKEILNKFVNCWEKVFGKDTCSVKSKRTPGGVQIWRVGTTKAFSGFLASIEGLQGHASGKYVPDIIMTAPENVACAYLAGTFDGDGTFYKTYGSLQSISEENRKRVAILLGNLGFKTSIDHKYQRVKVNGRSFSEFAKRVPICSAKANVVGKNESLVDDFVPRMVFSDKLEHLCNVESPRMKQDREDAHALRVDLFRKKVIYSSKSKVANIAYDDVETAANISEGTMLDGQLDGIVKSKDYARFAAIVSIKKLGKEKVYDLTVPGTHNYVANGIITHNSNVSWTWIADAEAKETGIIRIEQPKSRNSRAFPFFVRMVYEFMRVENLDQEQFGGLDSSGDGGLSGDDEDPKPKKNKKQQKEKKKERDKRNGVSSVPNLSDV